MPPDPAIRVLLVEDDEDDYVIVRDLLADAGPGAFRLQWVPSADRALEIFGRREHDAYLVDYRLGGRDGIDLIRQAVEQGCRQPIVLLTGQGGREVDLEAMEAGAADYLTKGRFDATTLERTLRYALRQKRLEDELRRSHDELEERVRVRTAELTREVTERRRAEAALKVADRRKDEFLAMLGHELRNPLTPIRCALQVLDEQRGSQADLERAREIIDRQVTQLVRLVDDLMDVSRVALGKITLRDEVVSMPEVISDAVEGARALIEGRGLGLETELPAAPVSVRGDAERLCQVFQNLLGNAAKYTERGGRVSVRLELQDGRALVRVRDTGLGIAAENLPHVFEPYAQADRTLARAEGGLGIGLTVVKRLVELHGGSVAVSSDGPGRGAEFTVSLPVVSGGGAPDAAPGRATASAPEAAAPGGSVTSRAL